MLPPAVTAFDGELDDEAEKHLGGIGYAADADVHMVNGEWKYKHHSISSLVERAELHKERVNAAAARAEERERMIASGR